MTELLQSHDKTLTCESCFLLMSKEFFETQVTAGEDDVKTVDITAKKQQQALRTRTSTLKILEDVLLWVKCYQTAQHVTEKSFMKEKVN